MKRREFLQHTGWFVVGASLVGVSGCDDNKKTVPDGGTGTEPEPAGTYSFPQGVASGDPRASSVVLWTRVVRGSDATKDVIVRLEVSSDPGFSTRYAERLLLATSASDHTLRVLVTNLPPNTSFYYRFTAGSDTKVGQSRTAPKADADVQINLAWVSCQDYAAGNYGAYRQMLIDDDKRPQADKIHAVVHLGDMIYETRAEGFQTAIDEEFRPIMLMNPDGTPRGVAAFPNGGTRGTENFAKTVADYRHLYRTFLSDPDIQAARARWPFISIWDDHEFTDDCWQSQANYTRASSTDEGDQTRRIAASQAWFEYVPVQLTGSGSVEGVDNPARDFKATTVADAAFTPPNDDNFIDEANNAAAIGAITIYRSLRLGKHVELVLTDERSYRSDHAVPEGPITDNFAVPRNALPAKLVNPFDEGKTANNNQPLDVIDLGGGVLVPNLRKTSPAGTMLGKDQKAWWKATMKGSDATWKLWGNEVMLMRMRIKAFPPAGAALANDLLVSADAWDGYNTERLELMKYLKDQMIENVVALTGDIHAAFAGIVMDNFDAETPAPVACELVGPGISSNSLFSFFQLATDGTANNALFRVDASADGGEKFTENFNLLLLHGTAAAVTFAMTHTVPTASPPLDPTTNPHLKYVDTNSQGYGYIKVGAEKIDAQIVTIKRPIVTPNGTSGPGIKRVASFMIPKGNPAGMTGPSFGTDDIKPFPLNVL